MDVGPEESCSRERRLASSWIHVRRGMDMLWMWSRSVMIFLFLA